MSEVDFEKPKRKISDNYPIFHDFYGDFGAARMGVARMGAADIGFVIIDEVRREKATFSKP